MFRTGLSKLLMTPSASRQYVIGLGANLGDRLGALRTAVAGLGQHGEVLAVSGLYESDPIGPPQPDYLNAAVLLHASLAPRHLLQALLALEKRQGRERREKWGPRTLDLDLLFSPGLVLDEPGLSLPHPELCRRAFALIPLLDVAPEAVDPRSGRAYEELLRHLDRTSVRRLESRTPGRAEWAC
jgi:2-amino-4-hydroxy-6-hydroxymethyldihydropteridine diphosphokinase